MRERAIVALLSENTIGAAAERCGLNEKTSRVWMADGCGGTIMRGFPCDSVGQRLTPNQLEHQRPHPVSVFQSIDRADVEMIE